MALTPLQAIIITAAIVLGTQITRWLPFIMFPENKNLPPIIGYLGRALPPAMMAFLVVFCLKNVNLLTITGFLPEAIAVAFIAALHLWKKNIFLSIGGGTLMYMFLVQVVFVG